MFIKYIVRYVYYIYIMTCYCIYYDLYYDMFIKHIISHIVCVMFIKYIII